MVSQETHADAILSELDSMLNAENIMKNVRLGIQKSSDQNILKRRSWLSGTEEYCYLKGVSTTRGNFRVKMTESVIKSLGLTKPELWNAAKGNTFTDKDFCCMSMISLIADMTGMDESFLEGENIPMYVISNRDRLYGAVQILNRKALADWAEQNHISKLVILPSSVHEVIVIPVRGCCSDLDSLSSMVREVNRAEVMPHEQLSNRAYILNL